MRLGYMVKTPNLSGVFKVILSQKRLAEVPLGLTLLNEQEGLIEILTDYAHDDDTVGVRELVESAISVLTGNTPSVLIRTTAAEGWATPFEVIMEQHHISLDDAEEKRKLKEEIAELKTQVQNLDSLS